MNRRAFIKLIAMGVISHELDIDRLLWIPGEKKIFLPSKGISESQIIAIELQRILPKLETLFDRDDYFYAVLRKQRKLIMEGSEIKVPIKMEPTPKKLIH